MPSVYGRNNLKFEPKDDVLVETEDNHFKMIAQTTRQRIVGKNEGTQRAVFVVFENKQELYKFYNSDAFMPYKLDAVILTEGLMLLTKYLKVNFLIIHFKYLFLRGKYAREKKFYKWRNNIRKNNIVYKDIWQRNGFYYSR